MNPAMEMPPALVLRVPPDAPAAGILRYALPFPFQCGPRTMGLMVMRMVEGTDSHGYISRGR